MGAVENRMRRQRGLTAALLALVQFAVFNPVRLGMPAPGTAKSLRPPLCFEIVKTLLISLKPSLKLKESYFRVVAHRYPP
jgi:hypothetical protein